MKTFIYSSVLYAAMLVFCTTSCSDDDEKTTPVPLEKEVTLSITGGQSVTVDAADVTKTVTITASEVSDKDIAITLKNDGATGQVAFPVNPVTIKAGKTSVTADVTFTSEGFPEGTAEKNIGISITSATQGVVIGTATTTFAVKGKDEILTPPVASIVANGSTSITVNDTDITQQINVALDKAATAGVTVNLAVTAGDATLSTNSVTIAIGQTTGSANITFQADKYTTNIAKSVTVTATSTDVTVANDKKSINYTVTGTAPETGDKDQLALEFKTEGTGAAPGDIHRMDLPYNNNGDGNPPTRYDFWIAVKRAIIQTRNVTLKVDIQGFASEDYYCSDINSEGQFILKPDAGLENWIFSIRFNSSAEGKNGKIIFRSDDATISSGEIVVTVR